MPVYLTLSIDQEIVEVLGETAIIAYMSQCMKKGILWFLWFVDLQIYMSSPLFGLQMCLLPEGSSSLYYMSANSKGSGETAHSPGAPPLLVAYVTSTLFSCVGLYIYEGWRSICPH